MKNTILAFGLVFLFAACKKDIPQKKLTVNVTPEVGGSVNPATGTYAMGSSVKLLATPSSEYIFREWTGGVTGITNPVNVVMDVDKTVTAVFEKRAYPLSLTIVGSGMVKEEIIKIAAAATNYKSGTTVRLTPQPSAGFQFKKWSGDDTTSKTPLDIVVAKPINLTCIFEKMSISSLKIENLLDTLVISKKHKYIVKGIYNDGSSIDLSDSVKITFDGKNVTGLTNNNFVGAQSGSIKIKIAYNNLLAEDDIYINHYEEIISKSATYLKENIVSSDLINVPVVIINFHPTLDGISIDPRRYLDDFGIKDGYYNFYNTDRNVCSYDKNNPACQVGTLEMYKQRAQDLHSLTKFGIEEGSKFRNFNSNQAKKTVNIQVVKYFNFYELKTKKYGSSAIPEPDYQDLFSKVNMENLINTLGIKEVWICIPPLSTEYGSIQNGSISKDFLLNLAESNMSSPTGDISNSSRFENDLPKYNKTYVVYGVNIDRGPSEALHNRGHQIESQLSFIEKNKRSQNELFWNKFVGMRSTGGPLGRAGTTHFPPNTNVDYDYGNMNLVESDIKNWKPDGGDKVKVNADTWTKADYVFPYNIFWNNKGSNVKDDSGYKWFIYWFQAFPNQNSNIPFTTNAGKQTTLTNWWDIFYNWDEAIVKNKTLWVE